MVAERLIAGVVEGTERNTKDENSKGSKSAKRRRTRVEELGGKRVGQNVLGWHHSVIASIEFLVRSALDTSLHRFAFTMNWSSLRPPILTGVLSSSFSALSETSAPRFTRRWLLIS